MMQEQVTTPPAFDRITQAYEELGMSCEDVKGWAMVLKHIAFSPNDIGPDEMRVISNALHTLASGLDSEREHLLRMTGHQPPAVS